MTQTKIIMGMPITINIATDSHSVNDLKNEQRILKEVFAYFRRIDWRFSPFKKTSEVSQINNHQINSSKYSREMKTILRLSEQLKTDSQGYFNIYYSGHFNPSGLVKGWAIKNAAAIIQKHGIKKFLINAGGDVEAHGQPWKVGIRHPFEPTKFAQILRIHDGGVATSGIYERGLHILNPKTGQPVTDVVSLTVIAPDIYEADWLATAAFAMGKNGIIFLQGRNNIEAYQINSNKTVFSTKGFHQYILKNA